ncbi:undecaprenyl-phosphate glucose phosphotransferase [Chitinibacter bivalviorum]|uniref:Undecaprenyl-phosphate glucose phosphotransferase n=2 Tax=Chitinibacter bivalviorum TaxID=2739434 RepID=A0A7H9BMK9_9NEIS|nr:undecaprenyl-phosphate glucose phosphotransferase [Chitinibacter bivalviorum]
MVSFFKLFLDPILVVACLYALSVPFQIATDGHELLLAAFAFLLTALLLDGVFLFVPGYSRPLLGVGRFSLEWLAVVVSLTLLGRLSGFDDYFYPPFILTWFVVAPVSLLVTHAMFRWLVLRPDGDKRADAKKVIIIGANQPGLVLAKNMQEHPFLKMDFVGFFDDRTEDRLPNVQKGKLLGGLKEVNSYVKAHNIQQIYISLPMTAQPRVVDLLEQLQDSTVSIYFVPDLFVFDLINARFDNVAGVPVVAICESPFLGMNGVVKRITDIILSLFILSLIWPILLAVAIAVKITSKGPVFFKQRRYGEDGQSVLVYKFRSMKVMEDGDKVTQATRNDSRLTPIGGFIRKTSLDELPQFINVLEGKMSIVGPRPHANAHNEQYRQLIRGYMIRHKVRPGITGWAQVNGYRGETDTLEKMQRRVEYDLDYLRNWSVWLDVKIIWQTATMMFRDRNAF